MPVYIEKSGDLVGCYHSGTDRQQTNDQGKIGLPSQWTMDGWDAQLSKAYCRRIPFHLFDVLLLLNNLNHIHPLRLNQPNNSIFYAKMGMSLQFQPFIQLQYCHSLEVWISKIWISGFPKFWEGIFPQLFPSSSRNIVIHWISRTEVDFAFVERQATLTGAWKCLQFDILAAESTSLQLETSNFLSRWVKQILL